MTHRISPLDAAAIAALRPALAGALVAVTGPAGGGRSTVARQLAGAGAQVLPAGEVMERVLASARTPGAPAELGCLISAEVLVVDEVGWLTGRERTLPAVRDVFVRRGAAGATTILADGRADGSLGDLLRGLGPVTAVELIEPTREEKLTWLRLVALEMGIEFGVRQTHQVADTQPWTLAGARAALVAAAAAVRLVSPC